MAAKGKERCRDDALAIAMASGESLGDAAKSAGVSPRTAARRNQDPDFLAKVEEIRAAFLKSAVSKVAGTVAEAADKVAELMRQSDDDRVQLRAAELLLKLGGVALAKSEKEAAPVIVPTRPKIFPGEMTG